jgi:hypothetical protein
MFKSKYNSSIINGTYLNKLDKFAQYQRSKEKEKEKDKNTKKKY